MLFTVTHYLDNYVTAIAWAVLGLGILAAMLQGLREMRRDVLMDEPTEAHKRTAGMLMYKDASKWSRSLLVRIVNASEI